MLGKGWFPSELGGLDRYYRELLEQLPEARGVVIGPAADANQRVSAVSRHRAPLAIRLLSFTHAAWRAGRALTVVDAHFALYAVLPVLGPLRSKHLIVHFQGPWAAENVIAGDSSRWRLVARRRLERAVYSRAAAVVTLTGAFRQTLIETYGVSPWRAVVLAPGVDLEHFDVGDRTPARERFGLAADEFVVCCVRRLVPRMGLDVLLEAWAEHVRTTSGRSRLLIAGDGELRDALEARVRALGLASSVLLLGRVGDDDLTALYRAADVNVLPTLAFEGFGLVVLEAGGCGTPSLVTRVGGLPEATHGLGSRLVVPPGDAPALAARLGAAKLGDLPSRAATRSWAESHAWAAVADAHRALLARIRRGGRADERLRVVYLDHVAQMSGAEIALARLLDVLSDVRAHVILAEDGPLVARLVEAGASVEVLPLHPSARTVRRDDVRPGRIGARGLLEAASYVLRLAIRLRRLRPDVVHTNSLKAGVYGTLAARLARRRVVWHVRDSIDGTYMPPLAAAAVRRLVQRLPHAVIANSHATLATLGSARATAVVYSVVPEVVPEPRQSAKARRRGGDPSPLVVGMVGRLARWKGQHVFLEAFAKAFPAGDERAAIVGTAMFGGDDDAYGRELVALAARLKIAERVEFRGFRENVWDELSMFDVLVHASTIAEPFGQVIVEGMAMGLPVVATGAGGPAEIITADVDGILYPPGDTRALAEQLLRLASDRALRERLGSAARRRARDFSAETVVARMTSVYEHVMST
jgi:glycosyltransferase involved in cell wall biosynthesis